MRLASSQASHKLHYYPVITGSDTYVEYDELGSDVVWLFGVGVERWCDEMVNDGGQDAPPGNDAAPVPQGVTFSSLCYATIDDK